ncbi:hypothetical protein niasHS_013222 [Heterodera schachtii]|uniref:ATP-dependent (S)-NAD(P)H-hydrate dehydratase n=1 Tax=Heterodera schachtii TaxID=97005 RepID=A0ABD2ID64_HETSC
MSPIDPDKMALLRRLFPVLGKHLRKGDCGKIGVIGGSPDYTGAPYFASITPMKIGADLAFVYAHSDAAPVIKSYSPELIVYPSTDFATNRHSIERLDALVFGPGLGRQKHTQNLLADVVNFVRSKQNLCLVIDADGLFFVKECLELFKGCTDKVIITPNHREFVRLYTQMFPNQQKGEDTDELKIQCEMADQLAKHLEVTVMRKGEIDIISNGSAVQTRLVQADTSMRRCGGQGDILSGATALFAFWARKASGADIYSSEHLLDGAEAASLLVRNASLRTFQAVGRSMNAADVIDHIVPVVRDIDSGLSAKVATITTR